MNYFLIITIAFEPITSASWWLLLPSDQDTNWFLIYAGLGPRSVTRWQETLLVKQIGIDKRK
jgi:hypothetical protein